MAKMSDEQMEITIEKVERTIDKAAEVDKMDMAEAVEFYMEIIEHCTMWINLINQDIENAESVLD